MKHPSKITIYLLIIYIIIQLFSMFSINYYYSHHKIQTINKESKDSFFNSLIISFLSITLIFIAIIYFKLNKTITIWTWLGLAFAFYLTLSIFFNDWISIILTILLLYIRKTKFRNFTELFVYPGMISILLPFFDLTNIVYLLILLSIYDFISVRITKHMILMANSQINQSVFSGIQITYSNNKKSKSKKTEQKTHTQNKIKQITIKQKLFKIVPNLLKNNRLKNTENKNENKNEKLQNHLQNHIIPNKKRIKQKIAILGGGDIAFPMILINYLLITNHIFFALSTFLGSIIGLITIYMLSEKGKYYPAIPYLTFFMFLFLYISMLL